MLCLSSIKPFLTENAMEKAIYLKDLGVMIEPKEQLFFYEETTTVFMSRHFPDFCQTSLTIFGQRLCTDRSDEKNSAQVKDLLVAECSKQWTEQLDLLQTITTTSEKRTKRSALATLAVFAGIVSALTATFSAIYHIFSEHEMIKHRSNEMYVKASRGSLITANIAERLEHTDYNLNNLICDADIIKNVQLRTLHANFLMQHNTRIVESEVLALQFGELPHNSNFLNVLQNICLSFEPNDKSFCQAMIYSGNLKVNFNGIVVKNNALVTLTKVEMPIQAFQFRLNYPVKLFNAGTYKDNQFSKINVPNHAIITDKADVFELDTTKCGLNFCSLNAVDLTSASRCLRSLLLNQTDHCVQIMDVNPICNFIRTNAGHIIQARDGIFFPVSDSTISAVNIVNSTILFRTGGRLLCQNAQLNSTHMLSNPAVTHKFNSSFSLIEEIQIIPITNVQQIERKNSPDLKIATELRELYRLDDKLLIGKQNYKTLNVIIITAFVVTMIFSLVFIVCYKIEFLRYLQRLLKGNAWPLCKNIKQTSIDKGNDAEVQTETELMLISGNKSTSFYPGLETVN